MKAKKEGPWHGRNDTKEVVRKSDTEKVMQKSGREKKSNEGDKWNRRNVQGHQIRVVTLTSWEWFITGKQTWDIIPKNRFSDVACMYTRKVLVPRKIKRPLRPKRPKTPLDLEKKKWMLSLEPITWFWPSKMPQINPLPHHYLVYSGPRGPTISSEIHPLGGWKTDRSIEIRTKHCLA